MEFSQRKHSVIPSEHHLVAAPFHYHFVLFYLRYSAKVEAIL